MDRISESLLNEFSGEQDITSLQEDKRFEHFASFLVVRRHYSDTFDTNEIVTGDGGDTGIDGIAVIVNGSMVTDVDDELPDGSLDAIFIFVQAETSPHFDAAKMGTFGFGVQDFFGEAPKLKRNQRVGELAAIMAALYKKSSKFAHNPSLHLYYATTGKWVNDANLEARRQSIISDLEATHLFGSVEFHPIDADALHKLYRQTKNTTKAQFKFPNCIPLPQIPGVTQAYLGFLPARAFVNLVQGENGEILSGLFYDNVRDWQSYNPVNSEMLKTLQSDANLRFVLMNNGITIIARKVQPTGQTFNIEDYQIVNGCQTSHVLYDQREKLTDDVMVPIRLIGTDNEEVINSIIRATNRQTEIKDEQFFATQEFPKQLETYFQSFQEPRKLYYERRSRQYDHLPIEKTRVITHQSMIRAFAAMFLDEPHRTTRNYSELVKKVGTDIFVSGHRLEPYYLAAVSFYKLEYLFRTHRIEPQYKQARFHILMAVRLLAASGDKPRMNSHDMSNYCNQITEVLWDTDKAQTLIDRAVAIIAMVAKNDFSRAGRDTIRTEPFTRGVIAECDKQLKKAQNDE